MVALGQMRHILKEVKIIRFSCFELEEEDAGIYTLTTLCPTFCGANS